MTSSSRSIPLWRLQDGTRMPRTMPAGSRQVMGWLWRSYATPGSSGPGRRDGPAPTVPGRRDQPFHFRSRSPVRPRTTADVPRRGTAFTVLTGREGCMVEIRRRAGGPQYLTERLAKEAAKQGVEVTLYVADGLPHVDQGAISVSRCVQRPRARYCPPSDRGFVRRLWSARPPGHVLPGTETTPTGRCRPPRRARCPDGRPRPGG